MMCKQNLLIKQFLAYTPNLKKWYQSTKIQKRLKTNMWNREILSRYFFFKDFRAHIVRVEQLFWPRQKEMAIEWRL